MATATTESTLQNVAEILESLGGISPDRVRLKEPLGLATEADLIEVNGGNETRCELVEGMLVEKGMGYNESDLALVLAGYLRAFIIPRNLGLLTGEAGMMRLVPGLIRIPDLAFASWDRIPGRRRPAEPVAGFAPDLDIEILSLSNTPAEMSRKRREYFEAGVRLVWEVDPRARIVAVFDAPDSSTMLDATQTLDGGAVLPGFLLPLADLFGELDRQGA
ncbi:Uma2 family endonuclease [Tundrisphaera lichenicola]|uniref:Uma2 family endonuclease n=1 Tax=Tundrisphaera lichenicola TaxID=2029860 RepID=UPI003EB930F7